MPCPDIGWAIFAPYRSKGYATEAAKRVLDWWRDEVGLKEIYCGIIGENIASVKCAQRIGLVPGGIFDLLLDTGKGAEMHFCTAYVLPGMQWKGLEVVQSSSGNESKEDMNKKIEESTARLGAAE